MITAEVNEKRNISKVLIIILIIALLITSTILGYFVVKNRDSLGITKLFNSNSEKTILLNEFVVNLKSETARKSYLKLQIALMYNDKKDGKTIESNVNKIRDTIINNLLDKTSNEILDGSNINNLKEELKKDINLALNEDLVKDVYITDLVIQ